MDINSFYTVYFENSYKEMREIGNTSSVEEVYNIIDKFLKDHNFKSYYKRIWNEEGITKIDVGSHSEFFYVKPKIT